ncbi:Uncharacterised protein [Porphyromonas cangingivalis]|uniref:Uncharacterized protein n=1 Tax=Porphyromonas cangingivalis TaxID=36874 RepID=A0A1T4JTG5_PORCN|nr:hypothetical protein SAMN02745205_00384 [Porphyromonas cangingivalis]SPY36087.1 Uncharacterised protein [Porphyromonas cangingivalis]VEJ04743.1 Uncharacterised protein [Porphyromonas cangingivalis]
MTKVVKLEIESHTTRFCPSNERRDSARVAMPNLNQKHTNT